MEFIEFIHKVLRRREIVLFESFDWSTLQLDNKVLVSVDREKTVSNLSHFTPASNVFSIALEAYEKHGYSALQSVLENYYQKRQCLTLSDLWRINSDKLSKVPAMSGCLPWSNGDPFERYQKAVINPESSTPLSREAYDLGLEPPKDYGWQFFGPVSSGLISLEAKRLIDTYESIKNKGYNPGYSGHMHGYILKKSNRYNVIVSGGKHRYAALLALGYERFPIIIKGKIQVRLLMKKI